MLERTLLASVQSHADAQPISRVMSGPKARKSPAAPSQFPARAVRWVRAGSSRLSVASQLLAGAIREPLSRALSDQGARRAARARRPRVLTAAQLEARWRFTTVDPCAAML